MMESVTTTPAPRNPWPVDHSWDHHASAAIAAAAAAATASNVVHRHNIIHWTPWMPLLPVVPPPLHHLPLSLILHPGAHLYPFSGLPLHNQPWWISPIHWMPEMPQNVTATAPSNSSQKAIIPESPKSIYS